MPAFTSVRENRKIECGVGEKRRERKKARERLIYCIKLLES